MVATVSKAQARRDAKAEATERLRELCPPGTTVYNVLRHVSASGMTRHIASFTITNGSDGKPRIQWLSGYMETAGLGRRNKAGDALVVGGCGMDMGFHVVCNLGYALHGTGKVDHLRAEWL